MIDWLGVYMVIAILKDVLFLYAFWHSSKRLKINQAHILKICEMVQEIECRQQILETRAGYEVVDVHRARSATH